MSGPRLLLLSLVAAMALGADEARAHCDALDGPVVRDARLALERGDPTPVLKWVEPAGEAEIREAFRAALAVRAKGDEARQLADRYFFETLVRVHRAGEGEGFTGLKPAGSVDPGIAAADRALESGAVVHLSQELSTRLADGIATRFEHALQLRQRAGDNVEAGRAYVAAYVDYIHFVESADRLTRRGAAHVHTKSRSSKVTKGIDARRPSSDGPFDCRHPRGGGFRSPQGRDASPDRPVCPSPAVVPSDVGLGLGQKGKTPMLSRISAR